MTLGPIAFLSPWLLAGMLALPVIWWLLRTVPPRPQRLEFPPTRILVGIENREKTPGLTPWWLTLIRMAAAASGTSWGWSPGTRRQGSRSTRQRPAHRKSALPVAICRHQVRSESAEEPITMIVHTL